MLLTQTEWFYCLPRLFPRSQAGNLQMCIPLLWMTLSALMGMITSPVLSSWHTNCGDAQWHTHCRYVCAGSMWRSTSCVPGHHWLHDKLHCKFHHFGHTLSMTHRTDIGYVLCCIWSDVWSSVYSIACKVSAACADSHFPCAG